ncbi:ABC transporter permease [Jeotgalibacillus proteolyticus]|uniref:ABC transporter permease n=1 Tax=Jeotgalibacillus proteolyticus TaxID=2082395 RepID=UPI003CEEEBAA
MPLTLFRDRLKKDWRYQKDVWSSVMDWTIVFYLIFPALFFSGLFYRSLWTRPPEWFDMINPLGWVLLFFFFTLSGKWRTYLFEADAVFLTKRPEWISQILQSAWVYNFFASFVFSLAASIMFLPYTVGIVDATILQNILLLLMLTIIRTLCKVCLSWIDFSFAGFKNGWRAAAFLGSHLLVSALIMAGIAYTPLLMLMAVPLLFYLVRRVFNRTMADPKWLPNHGLQEAKWKVRWIRLIFSLSKEVETPPHTKFRTRPLLFRKSRRIIRPITPVTGMLELFLKHHLRNPKFIYYYLRILALIILAAILIPVSWLFIAAAALLALGCTAIHKMMWETLIEKHAIGVKYRFDKSYERGKNWTAAAMFTPIVLIALAALLI